MNESTNPQFPTRRSFIKRSVVAAVAVSNMTILSGLVNATYLHPSPPRFCFSLQKLEIEIDIPNGDNIPAYACFFNGPVCDQKRSCGRMYIYDQQTGEPILDEDNKIQWDRVYVKCDENREDPNFPGLPDPQSTVLCFRS